MAKAYSCCSLLICTTFMLLSFIPAGIAANGCIESNIMINNKNNKQKTGRKLFVFGDSFADTGNTGKLGRGVAACWYTPYGMTFPKKPTGRFSDGRVITDLVAAYMGIKTPIPYKYRKLGKTLLPYGMNFAVGGAGVFDTIFLQNNLTVQIDHLQTQIDEAVFSKRDISSSIAFVVISGNDYLTLMANNPDFLEMQYITRFLDRFFIQLSKDIKRLESIGVSKVIIANLHPLSCIPLITRSSNYTRCPSNFTNVIIQHNMRFHKMVESLNRASKHKLVFPLDFFTIFTNILHQVNRAPKFEYPMAPCCEGITDSVSCGAEDEHGVKLYTLCTNTSQHFYWDIGHPTQAGWNAVFKSLEPSLRQALH